MKYLFLFLLLTACTAPRAEAKKEAMAETPSQVVENKDPEPIRETNENGEEYFNTEYGSGEEEEPETFSISEYKYNLYLTNINPYRREYEQFFEEQLEIYGRDSNGERLVNLEEIWSFNIDMGFSFLTFITNEAEMTKIEIIEHGNTNYYLVPDF